VEQPRNSPSGDRSTPLALGDCAHNLKQRLRCGSFKGRVKSEMSASNPNATGSAGTAFETKVAAACLTLLTRGAPLCLGAGTLRSVHLQAGHLGLGWRTGGCGLKAFQKQQYFACRLRAGQVTPLQNGAKSDFSPIRSTCPPQSPQDEKSLTLPLVPLIVCGRTEEVYLPYARTDGTAEDAGFWGSPPLRRRRNR
jgi:hypothetical protein